MTESEKAAVTRPTQRAGSAFASARPLPQSSPRPAPFEFCPASGSIPSRRHWFRIGRPDDDGHRWCADCSWESPSDREQSNLDCWQRRKDWSCNVSAHPENRQKGPGPTASTPSRGADAIPQIWSSLVRSDHGNQEACKPSGPDRWATRVFGAPPPQLGGNPRPLRWPRPEGICRAIMRFCPARHDGAAPKRLARWVDATTRRDPRVDGKPLDTDNSGPPKSAAGCGTHFPNRCESRCQRDPGPRPGDAETQRWDAC